MDVLYILDLYKKLPFIFQELEEINFTSYCNESCNCTVNNFDKDYYVHLSNIKKIFFTHDLIKTKNLYLNNSNKKLILYLIKNIQYKQLKSFNLNPGSHITLHSLCYLNYNNEEKFREYNVFLEAIKEFLNMETPYG